MKTLPETLATLTVVVAVICCFASTSHAARRGEIPLYSGPYCKSPEECERMTRADLRVESDQGAHPRDGWYWVWTPRGQVLAQRGPGEGFSTFIIRVGRFKETKQISKSPATAPVVSASPEPASAEPHPDHVAQQERDAAAKDSAALLARIATLERQDAETKKRTSLLEANYARMQIEAERRDKSSREEIRLLKEQVAAEIQSREKTVALSAVAFIAIGAAGLGILLYVLLESCLSSASSDGPSSGGTITDASKPRFAAARAWVRSVFRRSASQKLAMTQSDYVPVAYTVDRDPADALIGSTVSFVFAPECLTSKGVHPAEFEVKIVGPIPQPANASKRGYREVAAVLGGYTSWDIDAPLEERGDPVEVVHVFLDGHFEIRTQRLTKMIADSVRGVNSGSHEMHQHLRLTRWLAERELRIDSESKVIVLPKESSSPFAQAA